MISLSEFVTGVHELYHRYITDWTLNINSYWGGPEYRHGQYLKQYESDAQTPSETINTYQVDADGNYVGKVRANLEPVRTKQEADKGLDSYEGTFYYEKLQNVPNLNYLKLYVSEYNSMLFKNPPQRVLPDLPDVEDFIENVDGDQQSINEFMSQVDLLTTVYGVVWVSCIKFGDNPVPQWRLHHPTDVKNWEYQYDRNGNLKLSKLLIQLSSNDYETVYRYMDTDVIATVFVGADEDDDEYEPLIDDPDLVFEDNMWVISQPNPIGVIPCMPVYQNQKIYNGVGSTPAFDLAQLQRSIYGDMAEIYSTIAYSAHPSLIIDENTDNLNNGEISAEPGSIVRVANSLDGQTPSYVYEFAAPPLTALSEIRELVNQKIEKMNTLAMIRSEDLIRASRSGEQIREYDAKMEAFVRKKATNLENAEYNLWRMWFEWTNYTMPDDFEISYNRSFNSRALSQEVDELKKIMELYNTYEEQFEHNIEEEIQEIADTDSYSTAARANAKAVELGGSGFHEHTEDDVTIYMPFPTHNEYLTALRDRYIGKGMETQEETEEFKYNMRDQLRKRLAQLIQSTSSGNSL